MRYLLPHLIFVLILSIGYAYAEPQSSEMTYNYKTDTWTHLERVSPDMVYEMPLDDSGKLEPKIIMEETPNEVWLLDMESNKIEVYIKENQ